MCKVLSREQCAEMMVYIFLAGVIEKIDPESKAAGEFLLSQLAEETRIDEPTWTCIMDSLTKYFLDDPEFDNIVAEMPKELRHTVLNDQQIREPDSD